MPARLTVVVSQGQSHHPAKRKLEEDIVAGLLGERGIEVTVVPNLYDLAPDGTGVLCLQGINGDMVVLSWMYPRAAHWILNRIGIQGREGSTLLVDDSDDDEQDDLPPEEENDKFRVINQLNVPDRSISCIDLRVRSDAADYIDEIRRIATETRIETVQVATPAGGNGNATRTAELLSTNGPQEEPVVVDESPARRWSHGARMRGQLVSSTAAR